MFMPTWIPSVSTSFALHLGLIAVIATLSKVDVKVQVLPPFNSQGHIGTAPQHFHLWESIEVTGFD